MAYQTKQEQPFHREPVQKDATKPSDPDGKKRPPTLNKKNWPASTIAALASGRHVIMAIRTTTRYENKTPASSGNADAPASCSSDYDEFDLEEIPNEMGWMEVRERICFLDASVHEEGGGDDIIIQKWYNEPPRDGPFYADVSHLRETFKTPPQLRSLFNAPPGNEGDEDKEEFQTTT